MHLNESYGVMMMMVVVDYTMARESNWAISREKSTNLYDRINSVTAEVTNGTEKIIGSQRGVDPSSSCCLSLALAKASQHRLRHPRTVGRCGHWDGRLCRQARSLAETVEAGR